MELHNALRRKFALSNDANLIGVFVCCHRSTLAQLENVETFPTFHGTGWLEMELVYFPSCPIQRTPHRRGNNDGSKPNVASRYSSTVEATSL